MGRQIKMASDTKHRKRLEKQRLLDEKYHNKMRSMGFRRINIWVKENIIDNVKKIVSRLNTEEK